VSPGSRGTGEKLWSRAAGRLIVGVVERIVVGKPNGQVVVVGPYSGVGIWCTTLVATTSGLTMLAWFGRLEDALACMEHLAVDVCILSESCGVAAARRRIHEHWPHVRVVVAADHVKRSHGLACVRRVTPSSSRADLLAAVIPPMTDESASPPTSALELSQREREVALLVPEGFSNGEIATILSISISTVKNHVHRILQKLGTQRRGQVRRALASEQLFGRRCEADLPSGHGEVFGRVRTATGAEQAAGRAGVDQVDHAVAFRPRQAAGEKRLYAGSRAWSAYHAGEGQSGT
jgi:DNA-binding NarL/FixJ family response regulator